MLDRAGNNDTGLFPLATSGSPPSFRIGTISDSFHGEGNTDVKSGLFMINIYLDKRKRIIVHRVAPEDDVASHLQAQIKREKNPSLWSFYINCGLRE